MDTTVAVNKDLLEKASKKANMPKKALIELLLEAYVSGAIEIKSSKVYNNIEKRLSNIEAIVEEIRDIVEKLLKYIE